MRNFKSKNAFTLAEVLITLGIIGVVAAMTLPTLITNVQKQAWATGVRKFHSKLSNAVQLYMVEEGTNDLRYSDFCVPEHNYDNWQKAQDAVDNFIREHFRVIRECDNADGDKCFAKEYRNYAGGGGPHSSIYFSRGKIFVLSDGMVLSINFGDDIYLPLGVNVDINGQKGPNVIGYDMWSMSIFHDGVVDEGGVTPEIRKDGKLQEKREERFENFCKTNYGGCFGHFLNNNYKFDY